MPNNCQFLEDIKNSKLLAIYEDGCKNVQIDYEKNGTAKTVLIQAKIVCGMGHYHQLFDFSNESIQDGKKQVSLLLCDIETIKSITVLRLEPAYDEHHKIEIILESKNGNLLKLTIARFDDDEIEKYYTISQNLSVYEPIYKELFSVDSYKKHLAIALKAHKEQKTPHGLPYSFHIISVATEVINALPYEGLSIKEADIAIACALLHDVLEDTDHDLYSENLDSEIIAGVKALTKNSALPKNEQMADSLARLKVLPKYIQMVKLADRITNLDVPPSHWSKEKMQKYENEARQIEQELKSPNWTLNSKLRKMIGEYYKYYV